MKKLHSLLLSFLFVLCFCFCTDASGEEYASVRIPISDSNPLYEGLDNSHVLSSSEGSLYTNSSGLTEIPSFKKKSAAIAYMKERMLARETSVSFTLVSSSRITDMATTVQDIVYGTMDYSPTGAPDEGDYLRWNYKGYYGGYEETRSGSVYYYTVSLTLSYYTTASQEKRLANSLEKRMATLKLDGKSEYEKAKIIYEYVTSHVVYDDTQTKFSAYSAYYKGTAVCQGYATLYYRMCRMAGLQVRVIAGKGGIEHHGWNIVKVGNYYYNVDSTWDGETEDTYYRYFLKNNQDFRYHTRDAEYNTAAFHEQFPISPTSYELDTSHEHQWNTSYTVDTAPTCTSIGSASIHCAVCGLSKTGTAKTVAKLSHAYGSWAVTKKATIFDTGTKARSCKVCGAKQTKTIAKKTATVSLNAVSVVLQIKQTSCAVKIKTSSSGDSVLKWVSSDPSVVSVKKTTGKMTAKKTGSAIVTLTMKSGASASVRVKVQRSTVKTTKLAFSSKKATLKAGEKITLTLNRTPITANDTLTFTSSRPSVAKVSSKGVVRALSPGTATIKVKSASGKTAKCTITVK